MSRTILENGNFIWRYIYPNVEDMDVIAYIYRSYRNLSRVLWCRV